MARFLDRLGRTAARHKWVTIAIWLLIAVVIVVARPHRPHPHRGGRSHSRVGPGGRSPLDACDA